MLSRVFYFLLAILSSTSQIFSHQNADIPINLIESNENDLSVAGNGSQFSLIGVYYFKNEFNTNMTKIVQMERWLGEGTSLSKNSVLHFFTQWCPALTSSLDWYTTSTIRTHLNKFWVSGSIPLMTWQPVCYDPSLTTKSTLVDSSNTKTPDDFIKLIGSGTYDNYIIKVANEYKTFLSGPDNIYGNADDRRAYIRLGHEMNGNWYQWSVAKNPYITTTDYKNMWMRVRQVFDAQLSTSIINGVTVAVDHSTRLQWMWCPNNFDTGGVTAESYYPGDQYVDWLGFDVYNPVNNGGNSPSASVLMLPMIQRLQALSPLKPIAIPEYGTSYIASQGVTRKAKWLDEFFNITRQYGISMTVLFNVDSNAVYGSTTVPNIDEYVSIVKRGASWINHGDQSYDRLITDEAFQGYTPTYSSSSPTFIPSSWPTKMPLSTYIPSSVPTETPISTAPSTTAPSTVMPTVEPTALPSLSPTLPAFSLTVVQTFSDITVAAFSTDSVVQALQSTVMDILNNNITLHKRIDVSSVTVLTATDSLNSIRRFQSQASITKVTYSILFRFLQQQLPHDEPEVTYELMLSVLNDSIASGLFTSLLRQYARQYEADSLTTVSAESQITTEVASLTVPTTVPTSSSINAITPSAVPTDVPLSTFPISLSPTAITAAAPFTDTSGRSAGSVSSSVSSGAVAGIVTGVMVAVITLLVMLYLFCYHRQQQKNASEDQDGTAVEPVVAVNDSVCSDNYDTFLNEKDIDLSNVLPIVQNNDDNEDEDTPAIYTSTTIIHTNHDMNSPFNSGDNI